MAWKTIVPIKLLFIASIFFLTYIDTSESNTLEYSHPSPSEPTIDERMLTDAERAQVEANTGKWKKLVSDFEGKFDIDKVRFSEEFGYIYRFQKVSNDPELVIPVVIWSCDGANFEITADFSY